MARRRSNQGPQWDDHAPRVDLPYIPILSPKPRQILHLVGVCPKMVGIWTHFHLNRTCPCIGRKNGCICKVLELASRWKGYLGVYDPRADRLGLAEVTRQAVKDGGYELEDDALDLRGREITLSRPAGAVNGRVKVALGGEVRLAGQLPAVFPVRQALCNIWGIPYVQPAGD